MKELPHHYTARVVNSADEERVLVSSPGLLEFESAGPAEFDGPGDLWSPETLLPAILGDCFILTFRAVAAASKLEWKSIACDVEAVVDKVERAMQFTEFSLRAKLVIDGSSDEARAQRVLEKAERGCLVTNSLKAPVRTDFSVETG